MQIIRVTNKMKTIFTQRHKVHREFFNIPRRNSVLSVALW
jgi:hypothetical protein